MKKQGRNVLALVLALLLCLQLLPANASAADVSGLYGVWTGTYTGNKNGTTLERGLRLDIDLVSDGKIEGIATVDGGENGKYFFSGTVAADGTIQFQGTDWIDNPGNLSFSAFSGTYDGETGISGNVGGDESRLFTLTKVSDDYTSMRVDLDAIPREWDGEYDGHHGSTVVRRIYEIHIQSIDADGTIRGNAIFGPSEKADAVYGANGSYYFKGNIDARRGKITMQGFEWIEYPANSAYSDWGFVALDGYFDLSAETPAIHGKSENGIWEMTAIDYDSIHRISGFTLGKDNNNYIHSNSSTWDGAGFAGVKDYTIDNAYFQKLTQHSSKGEVNRIKKDMYAKWGGSCYGIAMSMGLLYEGYIKVGDLTNASGKNSYYSLDYPSEDHKFLNMINYYQLSQGLENGGKKSAAISASYNNGFLTGLTNWINGYDSLSVFLKKLVNYCASDHVELLGFSTKESGHAVLVTGCDFDKASDTYQVQIYDENCISAPGATGEFSYMTVAKDFSSFSYTDANGESITDKTYRSIFFLDWNSMASVIAPMSSDYSTHTRLSFPAGQKFKVETQSGKYLQYDGEALSGNIAIYGIDTVDYDDGSRFVIETDSTETLKITEIGTQLDLEAYSNTDYMALQGTSINSATIDMDSEIKLSGNNFEFEAFISTDPVSASENGLISLSAGAASDVTLTADGSTVAVKSDKPLTDVSTGAYVGTDATNRDYVDVKETFSIDKDAKIDGAIEKDSLPTVEPIPATGTVYARTQTMKLDGKDVEFQCYAVKNADGNETNYVKLRDLAMEMNGTKAQFNVDWDQANKTIGITSASAYKAVGGEGTTPYTGNQPYKAVCDTPVSFNGRAVKLTSFSITYQGGGYTYYKLRDLGQLLGFNVKWDGTSVIIETDKPYTGE